jgi:hypothetical protein
MEINFKCYNIKSRESKKISYLIVYFKEFDTSVYSIFDRQNMLVSLYDEIIDSILHIIDRLDLNVEKDNTEVMKRKIYLTLFC